MCQDLKPAKKASRQSDMGGVQSFAAPRSKGSYAQIVSFAKCRERPLQTLVDLAADGGSQPKAAIDQTGTVLRCGQSNLPFGHRAAFSEISKGNRRMNFPDF